MRSGLASSLQFVATALTSSAACHPSPPPVAPAHESATPLPQLDVATATAAIAADEPYRRQCIVDFPSGSEYGGSDCAVARAQHAWATDAERIGVVDIRCEGGEFAVTPTPFGLRLSSAEPLDQWLPPSSLHIVYGHTRVVVQSVRAVPESTRWTATVQSQCDLTDAGRQLAAHGWQQPGRPPPSDIWLTFSAGRWHAQRAENPPSTHAHEPYEPMFHL